MASLRKVFDKLLSGRSDTNVRFAEVCRILVSLGFSERINGDHHIYARDGVEEILNLQPLKGGAAKPYQVKQVRQIVIQYGLQLPERRE
jgi:hypothetical protein